MKVLFVGLGSAGQRHLRNFKKMFGNDVTIMAYRVRRLQRMFDDNMCIQEGKELEQEFGIKVYSNYDEALETKPDIVFITNRNSEHMEYALKAAQIGSHLFIEKPISDTLEKTDILDAIMKKNKRIAYVGYQNRLHPCIKRAKEILDEKMLGNIYMVYSEIGEYLPKMHPWEDYRNMHEANSKLGGGVVICQLHELDYLYYLFGMPTEIYGVGGKRSSLEIDVEDSATAICKYNDGKNEFAVNVHMDFLQSPPVRHCKIAGEFGRFEFDLINNEYNLYFTDGRTEHKKYNEFKRNDMFLEELELFMEAVTKKEQSPLDIPEGKKSIEIALAIKESIATGKAVKLSEQ